MKWYKYCWLKKDPLYCGSNDANNNLVEPENPTTTTIEPPNSNSTSMSTMSYLQKGTSSFISSKEFLILLSYIET